MSLSASDEIQTVVLTLPNVSGSTEQVQVDAEEDRRIVGWDMSIHNYTLGNVDAYGRAWVGVQPDMGPGGHELGGKFYTEGLVFTNDDTTNNLGFSLSDLPEVDPEDGLSFDWNEDVVLTFEASENAAQGEIALELTVYYREA